MTPALRVGDRVRYCKTWLDDFTVDVDSFCPAVPLNELREMAKRRGTLQGWSFHGAVFVQWDGWDKRSVLLPRSVCPA